MKNTLIQVLYHKYVIGQGKNIQKPINKVHM